MLLPTPLKWINDTSGRQHQVDELYPGGGIEQGSDRYLIVLDTRDVEWK